MNTCADMICDVTQSQLPPPPSSNPVVPVISVVPIVPVVPVVPIIPIVPIVGVHHHY